MGRTWWEGRLPLGFPWRVDIRSSSIARKSAYPITSHKGTPLASIHNYIYFIDGEISATDEQPPKWYSNFDSRTRETNSLLEKALPVRGYRFVISLGPSEPSKREMSIDGRQGSDPARLYNWP